MPDPRTPNYHTAYLNLTPARRTLSNSAMNSWVSEKSPPCAHRVGLEGFAHRVQIRIRRALPRVVEDCRVIDERVELVESLFDPRLQFVNALLVGPV